MTEYLLDIAKLTTTSGKEDYIFYNDTCFRSVLACLYMTMLDTSLVDPNGTEYYKLLKELNDVSSEEEIVQKSLPLEPYTEEEKEALLRRIEFEKFRQNEVSRNILFEEGTEELRKMGETALADRLDTIAEKLHDYLDNRTPTRTEVYHCYLEWINIGMSLSDAMTELDAMAEKWDKSVPFSEHVKRTGIKCIKHVPYEKFILDDYFYEKNIRVALYNQTYLYEDYMKDIRQTREQHPYEEVNSLVEQAIALGLFMPDETGTIYVNMDTGAWMPHTKEEVIRELMDNEEDYIFIKMQVRKKMNGLRTFQTAYDILKTHLKENVAFIQQHGTSVKNNPDWEALAEKHKKERELFEKDPKNLYEEIVYCMAEHGYPSSFGDKWLVLSDLHRTATDLEEDKKFADAWERAYQHRVNALWAE